MKGLNVYVKVKPLLKQYVEVSLQTTVIKPERGSVLVDMIKPYLELVPYTEPEKDIDLSEYIVIEIPYFSEKVYNHVKNSNIYCNSFFRNKLTEKGQKKVRRHFESTMKNAFRTFMDGYTNGVNETKVKAGVTEFFLEYRIDFSENDIASYTRDWHRYRNRKYVKRLSPILY